MSENILERLRGLVASERKITTEIISLIKEVDDRKLYLNWGHTSLFSFMTKDLGYTPAAAQRRIDAARLTRELPELKEDLRSGALNLSQVSMLVQCLRQKKKQEPKVVLEIEDKRQILAQVKSLDLASTEKIFADQLGLEIQVFDKKHHQQDGSVRVEATFSEAQMQELERVKELLSHQLPNPSLAEVVSFLAKEFLQRKDPLLKKAQVTSAPEAVSQQRTPIKAQVKRFVHQRDRCCQWRHSDGRLCGSRFQLQMDHRRPVWAGGGNQADNLQLLCSVHNRWRYRQQAGVRALAPG